MTRYSQNNEQDIILHYFRGCKGFFLDIGANDGVTLSNTYALQDIKIGEDYLWATAIHNSKLLQTEVKIDKELYHYQFRTNK